MTARRALRGWLLVAPALALAGVLTALAPVRLSGDRRPAPVMSHQGADWLERPGRDQEQRPGEVIRTMGLKDGDVVADVGCGTGYFARRMARAVAPSGRVYAVDIQPEMLDRMRGLLEKEGIANVVPVLGEPDDPKLPLAGLDWILLLDVYHELQAPKPMLARMRDSLKPGGRVALVEYRLEGDSAAHIRREHRMSPEEVLAEWEPAGFRLAARHEFLPAQHLFVFEKAEAPVRAFVGARLWDGSGRPAVDDAALLVRDGRIDAVGPAGEIAIPAGATRIELSGRFVIPGLVNAHGHVGETRGLESGPQLYSRDNVLEQLALHARYGVTTVLSLGGDQAAGFRVRDEQATPALDRARLFAAGRIVDASTPDEARAQVAAVEPLRPDFVKIRVDDNLGTTARMPPAVYRTVIDEAHRRGLRVAAHIFSLEDAGGLLAAGADLLAHSVRDRDVDARFVDALRTSGACLCPTLVREVQAYVYGSEPDFFVDPFFLREASPRTLQALRDPVRQEAVRKDPAAARYREGLDVARRNLEALAAAGIPIAFGTDSGPPARFQGYFEHLELELMVQAGLTPEEALVAATSGAARCLGLGREVGTLVPGAWADFVVLARDPLRDIRSSRTVETAYVAGNRVPPRP